MKKTLIIILISLFSFVFTQEKRSIVAYAGSLKSSTKNLGQYSDFNSGVYFGVTKNLGFFFINSPINIGLQYSERGGSQKINLNDYLIEGNTPINDNILDIPLDYKYLDLYLNANFSVGNISFFYGPMIGVNLSSEVANFPLSKIYSLDMTEFDAKKFDYGVNFGITFHLNRLIGLTVESYQGIPDKNDKQFLNYGLRLSLGL